MSEDSFQCSKCGTVTKSSDYDFKDQNLYQALKKQTLCENCAKGETPPKAPSAEQIFEQIHEASDCILKHGPTACVKLLEGVEAAMQKGQDTESLIVIHDQAVGLVRRTVSLLIPDKECIAKIPELWEAVGWLNGMEEHMLQQYEEFTHHTEPFPQIKPYIEALPKLMQVTRTIRRNLEKELFRSMVVIKPESVTLPEAADST
jgi:hypothetical protein